MMHRVNTCSGFSSFYKKYRSSAKGVIMTTTGYDTYRESVAGRADVADTPELVAYYRELERLKTAALWTVANKIEPWQPKSESVPVLWRYRDLREHVLRSVSLVTP